MRRLLHKLFHREPVPVLDLTALGREAHDASMDAHGELVDPAMAFEFIAGVYWDTDDARSPQIPAEMPLTFLLGYFEQREGSTK